MGLTATSKAYILLLSSYVNVCDNFTKQQKFLCLPDLERPALDNNSGSYDLPSTYTGVLQLSTLS